MKRKMDHQQGAGADNSIQTGRRNRLPPNTRWPNVIDELIEEAIRDGVFDNLKGHGKPLELPNNPFALESELAFQLLKNNDYTLPWIAGRNDVLDRIGMFRESISRLWSRYQAEFLAARDKMIQEALSAGWRSQIDEWQREIGVINKLVQETNMRQPAAGLEIMKLVMDSELSRCGARRELG